MVTLLRQAALAVALLAAAPVLADVAAPDLAARFATRQTATSVALSPLGERFAYVGAYRDGGRAVFVADLKTGETNAVIAGASLSLSPESCDFKTETRLICRMYGILEAARISPVCSRSTLPGKTGRCLVPR